jgi:hypothetical protein
MNSGMIGDTEVQMHAIYEHVWAIDIIEHTSEDTKELVEGWEVEGWEEALALYNKKVEEIEEAHAMNESEEVVE